MGGLPWEVVERMREHSPLTFAPKVRTPTLILHSVNDRRCPVAMGKMFHRALKKVGVAVEVLDVAGMKKLGMNALLGVGQGSEFQSRTVIMRWNGGKKGEQPLAFVGKGVCFDTGGISIKPSASMEDMKGDMGGAAAVLGAMRALRLLDTPVRTIGLIPATERAWIPALRK